MLTAVAKHLKGIGDFSEYQFEDITNALTIARMDKAPIVQSSAKEALFAWNELQKVEE